MARAVPSTTGAERQWERGIERLGPPSYRWTNFGERVDVI